MNSRTIKCGWCSKDTLRVYRLKDGKYLCLECATKHYNCVNEKMLKHIETIKNGLHKKEQKLKLLQQASCKHESAFNTGYSVGTNNVKEIWRCPNCEKTIYKDTDSKNN